jgi:hypothetical protein
VGREVKRVATSFDWPLDKTWEGYLNPYYKHSHSCAVCDGTGYSTMAHLYKEQWYGNSKFDPIAYGSELITPETPALKAFVEYKVDRSIREAAAGTALEFHPGFRTTRTGSTCYYTENGRYTREQAIERESNRLLEMFNEQWSHHLNAADVAALVEAERLYDFTRRRLNDIPLEEYIRTRAYYLWEEAGRPEGDGIIFWEKAAEEHNGHWLPFPNGYMPTTEEVNGWSIGGFGHDSINCHVCIEARCKREGYAVECDVCNGHGSIWQPAEAEQWYENWTKEEPPAGEAYQIWETVSEGSPISPAFSDPRILAEWMANSPTWGAAEPMSADEWFKWIIGPGWSPSGFMTNEGYKDGVAGMIQ